MAMQIAQVVLFMIAVIGWFNAECRYRTEVEKRIRAFHRGYRRGRDDYLKKLEREQYGER